MTCSTEKHREPFSWCCTPTIIALNLCIGWGGAAEKNVSLVKKVNKEGSDCEAETGGAVQTRVRERERERTGSIFIFISISAVLFTVAMVLAPTCEKHLIIFCSHMTDTALLVRDYVPAQIWLRALPCSSWLAWWEDWHKNKPFCQMHIRSYASILFMSFIRLRILNLWSCVCAAFMTDHPSYLLSSSVWKAVDIAKFLHQSAWAVHSNFSKRCTSKQHERMRNLLYSPNLSVMRRYSPHSGKTVPENKPR